MRAAFFTSDGSVEVRDVPTPEPGAGEVLIRVEACGICGTDLHILAGSAPDISYPLIPGHELAGYVVSTGPGVTHLAEGQLVAVNPNISCGVCEACLRARPHLCPDMTAIGVNLPGGFAEYLVAPATQALAMEPATDEDTAPLPFEPLSPLEAAMLEPTSCCVHGIDMAHITPGDAVVIQGAGPIGLLLLQLAKSAGAAPVVVIEPADRRREMAGPLGADATLDPRALSAAELVERVRQLTFGGADVVIEASGHSSAAQVSIALARRGGRVLFFGVQDPSDPPIEVHGHHIYHEELTIVGSFVNPFTDARARRLLITRRIQVKPLITHTCGLEGIADAIEAIRRGETGKVMVVPSQADPGLKPVGEDE